jgi:hypothetical protein
MELYLYRPVAIFLDARDRDSATFTFCLLFDTHSLHLRLGTVQFMVQFLLLSRKYLNIRRKLDARLF